jgi:hypothetical protein
VRGLFRLERCREFVRVRVRSIMLLEGHSRCPKSKAGRKPIVIVTQGKTTPCRSSPPCTHLNKLLTYSIKY